VEAYGLQAAGVEWSDDAYVAASGWLGNLPEPRDELVGRRDEIKSLAASLERAHLVTVTGVGGVGKTRLAIETAWTVADDYEDGVWFVELGALAAPDALGHLVASVLGVRLQPGEAPIDAIVDTFRGRAALVIVDNCEHLLEAVADLVEALVNGCRHVRVLATSREPIGVRGERLHGVPSLSPPERVDLFCTRVRAVDDDVSFSDDELATIAAIGKRLDGIPLAIELAAGRARSLSVADLFARLEDRFRLLRGAGRGGSERHQTLRATVTWSYQLLDETERAVFDRLSVFAGGFALVAAEDVAGGGGVEHDEVVDVLAGLVDKSMLIADTSQHPTRYRLLETLRQYGEEQLDAGGETAAFRERHLRYYTELAERTGMDYIGANQVQAAHRFDVEWDNLRAAHHWALIVGDDDDAVRIAVASRWYGIMTSRPEHARWNTATIEAVSDDHPQLVDLLAGEAWWAVIDQRLEDGRLHAARGVSTAPGPSLGLLLCHTAMAVSAATLDLTDEAWAAVRAAEAISGEDIAFINHAALACAVVSAILGRDPTTLTQMMRRHAHAAATVGSPLWLAYAATTEAVVALVGGRPEVALEAAERALRFAAKAGSGALEAVALGYAASSLAGADEHRVGEVCAHALDVIVRNRFWHELDLLLEAVAHYWSRHGDVEGAAVALGFHDVTARVALVPPLAVELEAVRHDPAAAAARARGEAMSRDALIDFVLKRLPAPADQEQNPR
jgi:predicted ATPase